jgi:uncharacterized membrane protein
LDGSISLSDPDRHRSLPGVGKGRLESLSDGIFSTVMTVLVLSLSVPIIASRTIASENSQLALSLRGLVPDILSYVISFAILGAFWIRHHSMFAYVTTVNRTLLWLNIVFLMTIGFIPFSTALLGRYPLLELSLVIYGLNLVGTSVSSQVLWIYSARSRLIARDSMDEEIISKINNRMTLGPIAYIIAIAISFYDPTVTFIIYIVTLFFFVFNTGYGFKFPGLRNQTSSDA